MMSPEKSLEKRPSLRESLDQAKEIFESIPRGSIDSKKVHDI